MRTIWYLRAPGRAERRGLVPQGALLSPPAAARGWAAGRGAAAHGCVCRWCGCTAMFCSRHSMTWPVYSLKPYESLRGRGARRDGGSSRTALTGVAPGYGRGAPVQVPVDGARAGGGRVGVGVGEGHVHDGLVRDVDVVHVGRVALHVPASPQQPPVAALPLPGSEPARRDMPAPLAAPTQRTSLTCLSRGARLTSHALRPPAVQGMPRRHGRHMGMRAGACARGAADQRSASASLERGQLLQARAEPPTHAGQSGRAPRSGGAGCAPQVGLVGREGRPALLRAPQQERLVLGGQARHLRALPAASRRGTERSRWT